MDMEKIFPDNTAKRNTSPETRRQQKYACTVVSMLPFSLLEDKPHMLPSCFNVPAMKDGKFGILHVEEGIHYIPNPLIDEGKPGSSIRQTTMPDEMARSIVDDYSSAQVALGDGAKPGLFWVQGRLSEKDVRNNYPELVQEYDAFNKQWFRNLCAMADADWNKNHNMLAVSDLQRAAARELGIRKDWVDMQVEESVNCPMCRVPVHPAAIICSSCKYVMKPDQYKKEAFANV